MSIEVMPVQAEDWEAVADIVVDAMADDFISQNIFPPHLASGGPAHHKVMYAKAARKSFFETQGKRHWIKAVESGSTTPIGYARWQDPSQWAADCATGTEENTPEKEAESDEPSISSITDEEFLDRFVVVMEDARKKYFPDGAAHWYCELVTVGPAHQRKGVGAKLLHWGIDQSEAAARNGADEPCYLESSKAGKGLYMKEGYEVVEDLEVKGWPGGVAGNGEPTTYKWPAMIRKAR